MKKIARRSILLAAFAFASSCETRAQVSLTNGLVAYYPLHGDTLDATGNGNDGIAYGAVPATNRLGISNGCYSFNGNSQYISAPASLLPSGNRTIALWFKANRLDNRPALLGYGGNACGNSFFMCLNHWGDEAYTVTTHCDVYTLRVPFTNAPVGNWYHWTVVMDDSGMSFYLNAQLIGARAGTSDTYVAGTQLGLGTISAPYSGQVPYEDVNIHYLDGFLEDVRFYNRALSQDEIVAIYNQEGANGGTISPVFTLNPVSQVVPPGHTCTFSATAVATPLPTYQWQFNGADIVGATNSSYTIPSAGLTNIGTYQVIAANSAGTNTSASATLAFLEIKMLAAAYLTAPTGTVYRLDARPELGPTNWSVLTNITISDQPFIYVDYSSATNGQQFYRAVPQ